MNQLLSSGWSLDEISYYREHNGFTLEELLQVSPPGRIEVAQPDNLVDLFRQLKPENKAAFSRDDRGFSRLYADCFRSILRYNVTAKEWYRFNGRIWQPDVGGLTAARLAKDFAEAIITYGFQCLPSGDEQADFIKFAGKYGDYNKRQTLVEDARSELFVTAEDFDRHGEYYCCQNGVFDLDRLELLPHSPEQMLSKISNVIYNPDAQAPRFERFLQEVMEGDSLKIEYLLKAFGYALTDETQEEQMVILYGASTRNGKSTLLETLAHMHGGASGYALTMQPEVLAQQKSKDSNAASGSIARLSGCRFLVTSEPPKRMMFDAALLKTLLGRDTIVARHLYQREFQFVPRFKLFMNTNYLPLISDDTLFTSGRIQVVEFNRHFRADEQDRSLKSKLQQPDEISGVFNWCLTGLNLYRETGLAPPSVVIQAVDSYRLANDKVQQFLDECMVRTGRNTAAGAAYDEYKSWCDDSGFVPGSKRTFFDELKSKKLFASRATVNGNTVKNVLIGYSSQPA